MHVDRRSHVDVSSSISTPIEEINHTYSYPNNCHVGDVATCEKKKEELDSLMVKKCNNDDKEQIMDDAFVDEEDDIFTA